MRSTTQKLLVIAALGACAFGGASLLKAKPAQQQEEVVAEKNPRQLIRRFWLDRLPKKRGDEIDAFLFLGGGIGLNEKGSSYRFSLDFFEFERQGSKAEIMWFHDKKRQNVAFEIVECNDKPPFDLCLDFKEPLRGHKRLYSFADDHDMDVNVPWSREWLTSSEARAKVAR